MTIFLFFSMFPAMGQAMTISPDSPATLFISWEDSPDNPGELILNWSLIMGTFPNTTSIGRGQVETWLHSGETMFFTMEVNTVTGVLDFIFNDRAYAGAEITGFSARLPLVPVGFRARGLFSNSAVNITNLENFPRTLVPGFTSSYMNAFEDGNNTVEGSKTVGNSTVINFFISDQPVTNTVVPEPGTSAMFFIGLIGLSLVNSKNR